MQLWHSQSAARSRCNTVQHVATPYNTLQHLTTRCNTLQHVAAPYNTLQHRTTRCNTTPRIEEDEALAAWRRSAHARRYCAAATGTSGSMRTSLMLASSLRVFLTAVASPLARRAMSEHVRASSVAARIDRTGMAADNSMAEYTCCCAASACRSTLASAWS